MSHDILIAIPWGQTSCHKPIEHPISWWLNIIQSLCFMSNFLCFMVNPYLPQLKCKKIINSYVERSLQTPSSCSREGEGTSPVKQIVGKVILAARTLRLVGWRVKAGDFWTLVCWPKWLFLCIYLTIQTCVSIMFIYIYIYVKYGKNGHGQNDQAPWMVEC